MRRNLTTTYLRSPDGATAVVAGHGAQVLSWVPAGGNEALFLSTQARYGPGDAIRGGVPIIFPQFAARGPGKRHGFVRNLPWRHTASMMVDGCAVARYALTSDEAADPHWPHRFALTYEVRLGGQQLDLSLEVHNSSAESWEFCAALHTYLRIDPRHDARLSGLQGVAYHDHVSGEPACRQTDAILVIASEVDRMYVDTPALLQLDDGLRIIEIRQKGFLDTVVWNPGADKGALLTDLEAGADRAFVCVEAAAIARPVVLAAGQRWHGTQTLQVVACAD